ALWAIIVAVEVVLLGVCGQAWSEVGRIEEPVHAIILLDGTRSLQEISAHTAQDAVRIVSEKILPNLRPDTDRVSLFVIGPEFNDSQNRIEWEPAGSGYQVRGGALDAVLNDREARPGSNYLGALRGASAMLRSTEGVRRIYVVGDLIHQYRDDPCPLFTDA